MPATSFATSKTFSSVLPGNFKTPNFLSVVPRIILSHLCPLVPFPQEDVAIACPNCLILNHNLPLGFQIEKANRCNTSRRIRTVSLVVSEALNVETAGSFVNVRAFI